MPVPFFPDIGWFYLAAKDAIFSGQFPLLGITTSVIWLHQGPLWTYFLIPALVLFNWHPIGGVFIALIIHIFTIISVYWTTRLFTDKKAALISALLYLISPYVLVFSLTPFDTSPIPLFTLLTLIFLKRQKYFSALIFLGFLYQVERVSLIFWPVVIYFLIIQKRYFKISDIFAFTLGSLPLVIAGPVEFFGPLLFAVYKIYAFIF